MNSKGFEEGLRLTLAKLYEFEPRMGALFAVFGPYCGEEANFVISAARKEKIEAAIAEYGPQFECVLAAGNAKAMQDRFGVLPPLAIHWFLFDLPPFEKTVEKMLNKVEMEWPGYGNPPQDIGDIDIVSEVIVSTQN